MIEHRDNGVGVDTSPAESAEMILGALPDALFRIRRDGTILDYKPSSMNLLGVDPGQLVGLHVLELAQLTDLLDAATLSQSFRHVQLAIEQDESQCLEVQLGGRAWPLWLEIRAFKLAADEAVVIIREISAERRHRAYQQHELADTRALVAQLLGEYDDEHQQLVLALRRVAAELPPAAAERLAAIRDEILPERCVAPEELETRIEQLVARVCGEGAIDGCVRVELCAAALTPEVAGHTVALLRELLACVERQQCADRVRVSLVNTQDKLALTFFEGADPEQISIPERSATMARVRDHVEHMGGSLRVTPGRRGTTISIQVELAP